MSGVVNGHALAIVDEVVGNVGRIEAADIDGGTVGVIVTYMRVGEFTEEAAVQCRRERLITAGVETPPTISIK